MFFLLFLRIVRNRKMNFLKSKAGKNVVGSSSLHRDKCSVTKSAVISVENRNNCYRSLTVNPFLGAS
ncbi:hypothetical protein HOLDEFILI_00308 [Holdemania filiformis DSM 12042]|uniref:Uncharacterized protein n=1 Tax=Holdemania filiformis DSM 12042 TaxID=545696 RepID=B9Y3D3_9FIRM|nr:hypothetical protein HOLDEFILI_00308 [Holdemania filiformis DSM 12042]